MPPLNAQNIEIQINLISLDLNKGAFLWMHAFWPRCGSLVMLKGSSWQITMDGAGLTPMQTVSSGPGCNIIARRERKMSWHACWAALEGDPQLCLVWGKEGTHRYTYKYTQSGEENKILSGRFLFLKCSIIYRTNRNHSDLCNNIHLHQYLV